jgi:translation elongation factor EF-Ts
VVSWLSDLHSYQGLKLNLEHPKISGVTTVQNAITEVAAMMGENVRLRRGFVMSTSSNGVLSTYLHTSPQPGTVISICFLFFGKLHEAPSEF